MNPNVVAIVVAHDVASPLVQRARGMGYTLPPAESFLPAQGRAAAAAPGPKAGVAVLPGLAAAVQ
eukprot:COSAG06_NODE_119_length_23111_cov_51.658613_7_plen_65_part_00